MSNVNLYDHSFDEMRRWIKNRIMKGKTWEEVKFGLRGNEDGLRDFLETRAEEDQWPSIKTDDWFLIVKQEKQEEDARQEMIAASKAAEINDITENLKVVVPDRDESSWQLYRKHLKEDNHFEDVAINNIEESCLGILKRLRSTTEKTNPIRGLVVGNVQSGKTANMAGLMAMAADYGWNMFIVLSGTIENLRKQTQNRLYDDLHFKGNLDWYQFDHLAKNMTNPEQRLSSLFLGPSDKRRYLTVCLKNKKRLNDLLEWLQSDETKTSQLKILLIDDEADQASVNTGDVYDENERKAINKALTNIVFCRDKKALNEDSNTFKGHYAAMNYISYTATPYANCLNDTHEESLYPRHFIRTLPLSNQYFGPRQIFGSNDNAEETLNIVREIPDDDVQAVGEINKGESYEIPESLEHALLWFLCAAAVVRYNNYKKPVSMLIHTSQKQNAHQFIADALQSWFAENRRNIIPLCRKVYNRETAEFGKEDFRRVYPKYSLSDDEIWDYPKFENLESDIRELSAGISAIYMDGGDLRYQRNVHLCIDNCANNRIDDEGNHFRLTYPDPKSPDCPNFSTAFIVIGGNTLSRGLTLEGLVSTYFFRTVKQADTLMQMGRWFGYRRHYELLPRIWMTKDTEDKFRMLSDIDMDLRSTLYEMSVQGDKTPLEFEPVIRTSPKVSWMRLTAKNKSQMAVEANLDYSGHDTQLTVYSTDPAEERNNIDVAETFLNRLGKATKSYSSAAYYWTGVPFTVIENQLLRKMIVPNTSREFNDPGSLSEWVTKMTANGLLTDWNVAAVGTQIDSSTPKEDVWKLNEFSIGKVNRTARTISEGKVNIGVLSSKKEYLADIDEDRLPQSVWSNLDQNANAHYNEYRKDAGFGTTPLILLYRIDRRSAPKSKNGKKPNASGRERKPLNTAEDLIGMAMVIPGTRTGKYYVKAKIEAPVESGTESEL